MTDEPQPPSNSAAFTKMAARIEHNKDAGFGGACVIVPPRDAGEPIEIFIIDDGSNPAQFYSAIASRIEITLEEQKAKASQNQAFGYRPR